jgi:hypothetical protein
VDEHFRGSGDSGGGGGADGSGISFEARLKLRLLEDQLAAERKALDRQMTLVKALSNEILAEEARAPAAAAKPSAQSLLRLVVMLDHAAHLARRCLDLMEQRRDLLIANPSLAQDGLAQAGQK